MVHGEDEARIEKQVSRLLNLAQTSGSCLLLGTQIFLATKTNGPNTGNLGEFAFQKTKMLDISSAEQLSTVAHKSDPAMV
ncbi:unnamed protein product, partial [Rotaria sp. Silwood1]